MVPNSLVMYCFHLQYPDFCFVHSPRLFSAFHTTRFRHKLLSIVIPLIVNNVLRRGYLDYVLLDLRKESVPVTLQCNVIQFNIIQSLMCVLALSQ